ncbi:MAG: FAD-dependent thymidylate synthase [Actinobacteria bacterium]|nr:FAD-dependent thymidylate synthase [Actinomycetota bacterium]
MKVKLISYSQASKEMLETYDKQLIPNIQDLVAFCARVSNPTNQLNTETSDRLLQYLIRHRHWSPFEMVSACLEIESTRDIVRQILRHRSFSFQEFSQRYADPTKELSFTIRDARLQDASNRQNSTELDFTDPDHRELAANWREKQQKVIRAASAAYEWAVSNGIAKEQARAVLPEGLTVSRLYIHGTIRSWIHYCELRSANGTQSEHQEIALACAKVISSIFPVIKG